MDENRRRRWLVVSLRTLLAFVAVAAVAIWIVRSREPKLVPIVVADAAAFVRSDLVLFNPRLPFGTVAGSQAPPDPAAFRGKTVLSVRGAERAQGIASILSMAAATPGMALSGNPEADALFQRLPLNLKADDYELLRYDAAGHATRLPTQDIDTVVVKKKPPESK